MELLCSVMKYDWGELGRKSIVARLAEKNNSEFVVDDSTPYAELWMGTHPNGPAVLKKQNKSLLQHIDDKPSCLGDSHASFGADLSFLLKILSVRKALSLQVHPNKEEAQKLHLEFPKLYPDNNHKPELAVALTEFEALCGFRPLEEIAEFIKTIPELARLIDPEHCHNFLKQPSIKLLELCFSSYITASPVDAKKCTAQFIERVSELDFKLKKCQLADLFIEINKQFPGDIGLFAIYFFNHVTLQPGEAIYVKAGLPHAYLKGDCIEIMARSDNVVRAGLTPKVRDVVTLLKILDYNPISEENVKFNNCILYDQFISIYKPPISDFALSRICVPENQTYTLPVRKQASLLIIISGRAECEHFLMQPGVVLFLPTDFNVTFTVTEKLTMFQAYANL